MSFESAISEATTKFFRFCATGWWRWWVLAPSALTQSERQTAKHSQISIFLFCPRFVLRWPRVPFDVDIFRCVRCRGERLHIGNCHHKICVLSLLWQFHVMLLCLLEMPSFALSALSALHLYIFLEALCQFPLPSSSSLVSFRHYFIPDIAYRIIFAPERNETRRIFSYIRKQRRK